MLQLEDLDVYRIALDIREEIWQLVQPWEAFAKHTVGNQFVRSADSIGANIAEGFGRFHYKGNKMFCYYAPGVPFWKPELGCQKAGKRKLISEKDVEDLTHRLENLQVKLNAYIKSIGQGPIAHQ